MVVVGGESAPQRNREIEGDREEETEWGFLFSFLRLIRIFIFFCLSISILMTVAMCAKYYYVCILF